MTEPQQVGTASHPEHGTWLPLTTAPIGARRTARYAVLAASGRVLDAGPLAWLVQQGYTLHWDAPDHAHPIYHHPDPDTGVPDK